jgi:probable phosphoglycerate mutase
MLLFLERHGESTFNREKKIQGQKDPRLSPFGRKEAQRLAQRFDELKFAAVYSSPLRRAQETARIIVGARSRIICEAGLAEWGLGKWEGKTLPEIRRAYGDAFRRWVHMPSKVPVPGGEDFKEFVGRVRSTFAAITKRHRKGNVLVVCHGGVISTYATMIMNLTPDHVWCVPVRNAALTIVEVGPRKRRLVTFNDTGHLMTLQAAKAAKEAEVVYVA